MKILLIWFACIFILSVMPAPQVEVESFPADKVFHAIVYAITTILVYTVLREKRPRASYSTLLMLSVAISCGYGIFMEVAQTYTETRSFSGLDIIANLVGSLAGMFYTVYRIRKSHRKGG